jgi:hypothetical protein
MALSATQRYCLDVEGFLHVPGVLAAAEVAAAMAGPDRREALAAHPVLQGYLSDVFASGVVNIPNNGLTGGHGHARGSDGVAVAELGYREAPAGTGWLKEAATPQPVPLTMVAILRAVRVIYVMLQVAEGGDAGRALLQRARVRRREALLRGPGTFCRGARSRAALRRCAARRSAPFGRSCGPSRTCRRPRRWCCCRAATAARWRRRRVCCAGTTPWARRRRCLDEGPLSLPPSNLLYMENPYSYKKCQ